MQTPQETPQADKRPCRGDSTQVKDPTIAKQGKAIENHAKQQGLGGEKKSPKTPKGQHEGRNASGENGTAAKGPKASLSRM